MTASVYKGSKLVSSRTLYSGSKWTLYYQNSLTGAKTKWPKGTYYVKIAKNSKTDSGLVQVKMK